MRALLILVLVAGTAWAHKPSDAHLQLTVSGDRIGGSLAVAIRDLDGALDLDADGDGNITWGEVRAAAPRIDLYERTRLIVEGCPLSLGAGTLVDFSDGAYWTVPIDGRCTTTPSQLRVTYKLLFDIDAQHRGIVQIATARATTTVVARSGKPIEVELAPTGFASLFVTGLEHVALAPQHLLVLVLLLLPVVGDRRRTLAAFLVAALTTMLLAGTGLLHLPGPYVELALAVTALIAGAANLISPTDRYHLAFELGLVHGLGFALWLTELDAPRSLAPYAGFGLGLAVALGALGAALTFLRLPRRAIQAISLAGIALALVWALQA